jgi:hypothetical protein
MGHTQPEEAGAAARLSTDDLAAVDGERSETGVTPEPETDGQRLFEADRSTEFRTRWQRIQVGFVDEPREAVAQGDALVAEVLKDLARTFAEERRALEKEWTHGDEVSTEDLRQALRHYRSFFDRLLSL